MSKEELYNRVLSELPVSPHPFHKVIVEDCINTVLKSNDKNLNLDDTQLESLVIICIANSFNLLREQALAVLKNPQDNCTLNFKEESITVNLDNLNRYFPLLHF